MSGFAKEPLCLSLISVVFINTIDYIDAMRWIYALYEHYWFRPCAFSAKEHEQRSPFFSPFLHSICVKRWIHSLYGTPLIPCVCSAKEPLQNSPYFHQLFNLVCQRHWFSCSSPQQKSEYVVKRKSDVWSTKVPNKNWCLSAIKRPRTRSTAARQVHPKIFLRLLCFFWRTAALFRQIRTFPQLFRFCSDLGNPGIRQIVRDSMLTGRWWEGRILISLCGNNNVRNCDLLQSDFFPRCRTVLGVAKGFFWRVWTMWW